MNTESSLLKPLALIAGPTASGKSALALAIALQGPSTIINADASQVYRDLRILSARPSAEDEAEAPHTLFGHIDGAQSCSAAQWAQEARAEIERAWAEDRLPVLVGGTGLYIRTLLDGIAPVPEIDPIVRAEVRALPVDAAYAALAREDPEAAQRLNPRDTTRVARALEVVRSTGKPIATWQSERVGGIGESVRITPALLLPPREWLFERCDQRFSGMIEQGGLEEVSALLSRNLDPDLPVMRAIGVREMAGILAEPDRRPEFEKLGQIATRQFAKRQYTWFRNQPPPDWLRITTQLNNENINKLAIKLYDMALTI